MRPSIRVLAWVAYVVAALLLLDVAAGPWYFVPVAVGGLALAWAVPPPVPPRSHLVAQRRPIADLGITGRQLPATLALALLFAVVQSALTLPGVAFGSPESWIPLLGMALAVGFFEAVFFRAYVVTPLGGFFNNVTAGDIEMPLIAVLGFLNILGLMLAAVLLVRRWQGRHPVTATPGVLVS
jgi:hypothetical protein